MNAPGFSWFIWEDKPRVDGQLLEPRPVLQVYRRPRLTEFN